MRSVDMMREWASSGKLYSDTERFVLHFADEIEREIAETEAFCRRVEEAARNNDELDVFGVAYMPLPTDADGVPIRPGDKLIAYNERFDVEGIGDGIVIYRNEDDELGELFNPAATVHVKPRTLEDVLADFAADAENDRNTIETARKYADEIRELLDKAGD